MEAWENRAEFTYRIHRHNYTSDGMKVRAQVHMVNQKSGISIYATVYF